MVTIANSITFFVVFISKPPNPGVLLGAPPKQNYLNRLKEDDCVENQTMILDVEEIVLQLLSRVLN